MQICWTLFIANLLLLGGFGLFMLHLVSEFTAAITPVIYIALTVVLPALVVGYYWLEYVGARIRHWRVWNSCGRRVDVELSPSLSDVNVRTSANVAYAYIVEYDTPAWESDIPLEALFTFVLPGTRNLHLRQLPTVFAPTSLMMEPWLGWLLPYVGVEAAPTPHTVKNAFTSLYTRDVVLLNPSDPAMPLDGFVDYASYFYEALYELEYHIIPVRVHTPRRLEHEYRWYGRLVPAAACLFGVAPASLPLLLWSWLRMPRDERVRVTMGAPVPARDLSYADLRGILETTGKAKAS